MAGGPGGVCGGPGVDSGGDGGPGMVLLVKQEGATGADLLAPSEPLSLLPILHRVLHRTKVRAPHDQSRDPTQHSDNLLEC